MLVPSGVHYRGVPFNSPAIVLFLRQPFYDPMSSSMQTTLFVLMWEKGLF